MTIGIRAVDWSLFLHRITTHPQAQSRLVIPRTIVVHTSLLIKFLGVEEVRRVLRIVAFFKEYFAKWNVFDVLRFFAIKVGDVATAAQMVGVVVELHLLVVVIRLEVTICSPCTCPCLCRLRRTIVAAELSCKREEIELVQAFPSVADYVF